MKVNSVNDTQAFGNGKATKRLMKSLHRKARKIANAKRIMKAHEKMYNQEVVDIDRFVKFSSHG